jgi:hypothetical protein
MTNEPDYTCLIFILIFWLVMIWLQLALFGIVIKQ